MKGKSTKGPTPRKRRTSKDEDVLERGRKALVQELGVHGTLKFIEAFTEPASKFSIIHGRFNRLSLSEAVKTIRARESVR